MSRREGLKPCPFCGGHVVRRAVVRLEDDSPCGERIFCDGSNCPINGLAVDPAFWSRRAAPPADGEVAKYREALEEMVYQHCPIRGGRFDDMALSANAGAIEALGPDFKPSAEAMCEVPGCGNGWTVGTPETPGSPIGYHRRCSKHPFRVRAAESGKEGK